MQSFRQFFPRVIAPSPNKTNKFTPYHIIILRLIDLRFYVPLKNFSLTWRRHHCRWRVQNLGLCSALRAFKQGGIFIVPHLLWHGAQFFRSYPKDRPIQSPLMTHKEMWRTYSHLDSHGSPFSRLLRHARGCRGPILTLILMGKPYFVLENTCFVRGLRGRVVKTSVSYHETSHLQLALVRILLRPMWLCEKVCQFICERSVVSS
jgi:hypothetical protein